MNVDYKLATKLTLSEAKVGWRTVQRRENMTKGMLAWEVLSSPF